MAHEVKQDIWEKSSKVNGDFMKSEEEGNYCIYGCHDKKIEFLRKKLDF